MAAASGVGVSEACMEAFKELKLGPKSGEPKLTYIIYALSLNFKEIVVHQRSKSTEYDEFLKELPEDECRWAVYDVPYEKDGGKRNKLVFFSWAPEEATIRQKMVHASSKEALRNALNITFEIQATDFADVDWNTVLGKVRKD